MEAQKQKKKDNSTAKTINELKKTLEPHHFGKSLPGL